MFRRFFPSTEPAESTTENEDEWEEVKEGESAENGVPKVKETKEDNRELFPPGLRRSKLASAISMFHGL
jgi:hypothetical protein